MPPTFLFKLLRNLRKNYSSFRHYRYYQKIANFIDHEYIFKIKFVGKGFQHKIHYYKSYGRANFQLNLSENSKKKL